MQSDEADRYGVAGWAHYALNSGVNPLRSPIMATTNEQTQASCLCVSSGICDFCEESWYPFKYEKEVMVHAKDRVFPIVSGKRLNSKAFRFERCTMPTRSLNVTKVPYDTRKGANWEEYLKQHYTKNSHHPQNPTHNEFDVFERVVDVVTSISRVANNRHELVVKSIAALKAQGDFDRFPDSKEMCKDAFAKLMPYIFQGSINQFKLFEPKINVREWRDPKWVSYCHASLYPTLGSGTVAMFNTLVKNYGTVHCERIIKRIEADFLPYKRCVDEIKVHIENVEHIMEVVFGRKIEHDRDKLYFPMTAAYFIKWSGLQESGATIHMDRLNRLHSTRAELMTFSKFQTLHVESQGPEAEGALSDVARWIKTQLTPVLYTETRDLVQEVKKTSVSVGTTSDKTATLLDTLQKGMGVISNYFGPGVGDLVQTLTDNQEFLTLENLFKAATLMTNIMALKNPRHKILNGIMLLGTLGVDLAFSKELATAVYNAFVGCQIQDQSTGLLVKNDIEPDSEMGFVADNIEISPTVEAQGPFADLCGNAEKIMKGSVIPLGTGFLLFTLIAKFLQIDAKDQPECHWTRYFAKYGQFARDVIGMVTLGVIGFEALVVVFKFVASVYTYFKEWYQVKHCDKDDEQLIAETQVWKDEVNAVLAYSAPVVAQDQLLQNRLNAVRNKIPELRKLILAAQNVKHKPVYNSLLTLLSTSEKDLNELFKSVSKEHKVNPTRPTPFAIRLIGDPGIGKSILSQSLAYKLCSFANIVPQKNSVSFSWDFADKYKQGYNMEPVVIMDDPEINAANNEAFATMILIISKTPYFVPKANVTDKDYCFKSPFIIVNTNIKNFTNDNIQLRNKAAYLRRFMHVEVTKSGEIMAGTHGHLRFTVESKDSTTNWMKTCKNVTYEEFLKVLEENYRLFAANQKVVEEMYDEEYKALLKEAPQATTAQGPKGEEEPQTPDPCQRDKFTCFACDPAGHFPNLIPYVFSLDTLLQQAIRSKFARAGTKFHYPKFTEGCSVATKLMFAQLVLAYDSSQIMDIILFHDMEPDKVHYTHKEFVDKVLEIRADLDSFMEDYNIAMDDLFEEADAHPADIRANPLYELRSMFEVYITGETLVHTMPDMEMPDSVPIASAKEFKKHALGPEFDFPPDTELYLRDPTYADVFTPERVKLIKLGELPMRDLTTAAQVVQQRKPHPAQFPSYRRFVYRRAWRKRQDLWEKIKKGPTSVWQKIKTKIPTWFKTFLKTCAVVIPIAGAFAFVINRLLGTDTYKEEVALTEGGMTDCVTALMKAGYTIAKKKIVGGNEVLVAEGNPYDVGNTVVKKATVKVVSQGGTNVGVTDNTNNDLIYRKAVAGGLSLISVEVSDGSTTKLHTYHCTAVKAQWFITSRHVAIAIRKLLPGATMLRIMNKGYLAKIKPNDLEIVCPFEKVDIAFIRPRTNSVPASADITKHFISEQEVAMLAYTPIKMPFGELRNSPPRLTAEDLAQYPFNYEVCVTGATRVGGIEYTDKGEDYVLARGYRYKHSAQGNCGWPVFSGTTSCPKLLGLHTAGDHIAGFGFCNIVTREMMEEFFQKHQKVDDISISAEMAENATRFYTEDDVPELPRGDYAFVKRLPKELSTHLPTKVPYQKMPTYNLISVDDREPAPQTTRDWRNIYRENMLQNCAEKYADIGDPFEPRFLQEFEQGFCQEMDKFPDDGNIILDYHQSLNGVPFSHIEPMNLRTSAGYPFTLNKSRPPGKVSYVLVDESGVRSFTTEMRQILEEHDRCDREKIPIEHIYSDAIKVELLPLEKTRPYLFSNIYTEMEPSEEMMPIYVGPKHIETRRAMFLDQVEPTRTFKPRLIDVPSMVQTVQSRMTNAGFNNFLMKNRHEFGILIGINPESCEWGAVKARLEEVSSVVQDFDFKNFDGTHQRSVIAMISRLYHHFNLRDQRYRESPDSEWLQQRHFRIWDAVATRTVVMGSLMYRVYHGLPSGYDCTSQINSLAQDFYYFVAWKKLIATYKPELATYKNYRLYVRTVKYGDDGLMAVVKMLEKLYSASNIKKSLSVYGVNIQPAKKFLSGFPPPRPIVDVTFLSRGFVQHPEYSSIYYAPLKEESVNALLNWAWVTGRDKNEAFQQNLVEHLRHYYPNGETAYKQRVREITQICVHRDVPVPAFPLWIELETNFLQSWGIVDNSIVID
nr:MAG: RNA-dependent RNA polymerase [Wufeng shrew picorna-like virus 20]